MSGTTCTWAHHAVREGHRDQAIQALWITVGLGLFFTFMQGVEYYEAALHYFSFTDGIYPSVFYMATGFHGFHVMVGTAFLAVCLYRVYKNHFTPDQHFGLEAAAWYWHFVDVVRHSLYVFMFGVDKFSNFPIKFFLFSFFVSALLYFWKLAPKVGMEKRFD